MQLIDIQNAADYLRRTKLIGTAETVSVRELAGGVSNLVLHVARDGQAGVDFVLKQARAQLRVPQPWFCSVERIWREVEVLQVCESVLLVDAPGQTSVDELRKIEVPRVLFQDHENFLFTMTAAPPEHSTWKQQLLSGVADENIAGACGDLLGKLHGRTWQDESVAARLENRQFFDDLRLDPYYRQIGRVFSELSSTMNQLVDSVLNHRRCLVHGDFSPKNLLVWPSGLMLIDFEVGHFGDPAFDLGFFLTHLVLKSFWTTTNLPLYLGLIDSFWQAYVKQIVSAISPDELRLLEERTAMNLGGCLLARMDGKSRVDYDLPKDVVRQLGRQLLAEPQLRWNDLRHVVELWLQKKLPNA